MPDLCTCAEGFYMSDGQRVKTVGHDCAYILRRDALIPEAELIARIRVTEGLATLEERRNWTTEFMAAMDYLARDRRIYRRLV